MPLPSPYNKQRPQNKRWEDDGNNDDIAGQGRMAARYGKENETQTGVQGRLPKCAE